MPVDEHTVPRDLFERGPQEQAGQALDRGGITPSLELQGGTLPVRIIHC